MNIIRPTCWTPTIAPKSVTPSTEKQEAGISARFPSIDGRTSSYHPTTNYPSEASKNQHGSHTSPSSRINDVPPPKHEVRYNSPSTSFPYHSDIGPCPAVNGFPCHNSERTQAPPARRLTSSSPRYQKRERNVTIIHTAPSTHLPPLLNRRDLHRSMPKLWVAIQNGVSALQQGPWG